jgi:hypothetical protein
MLNADGGMGPLSRLRDVKAARHGRIARRWTARQAAGRGQPLAVLPMTDLMAIPDDGKTTWPRSFHHL